MNRIKLLIATWNVGSTSPPDDLSAWLAVGNVDFDLVVVGAQEVPSQFKQGSDRRRELAAVHRGTRKAVGERISGSGKLSRVLSKVKLTPAADPASPLCLTPRTPRAPAHPAPAPSSSSDFSDVVDRILAGIPSSDDDDVAEDDTAKTRNNITSTSKQQQGGGISGTLGHRIAHTGSAVGRVLKRDKAWRGDDLSAAPPIITGSIDPTAAADAEARSSPVPQQQRYSTLPPTQTALSTHDDATGSDLDPAADKDTSGPAFDVEQSSLATLTARSQTPSWGERLGRALGDQFVKVQKKAMFGIRLHVFVRRKYEKRVTVISRVSEGTGVANVLGNKGAVAIKIAVDDTVFTFVSCHLAAHEGVKHLAQRNQDVVEILKNLEPVANGKSVPSTLRSHHVFWLGDLNYRLDLTTSIAGADTWTTLEKCQHIAEMAEAKKYKLLSANDELCKEISAPDGVFIGFREGKIRFPPTFKLHREAKGYCYDSERAPSYCDRVLWHSLANQAFHVKLDRYTAVPTILTSDHKPVHAAFTIQVPVKPRPIVFETRVVQLALEVRSISATILWKSGGKKSVSQIDQCNGLGTSPTLTDLIDSQDNDDMEEPTNESGQMNSKRQSRRVGMVQLLDWSFGEFLADDTDPKLLSTSLFHSNPQNISGLLMETHTDSYSTPGNLDLIFGGPIALQPVRGAEELNHKHISLVFSRSLSGNSGTGKLLPTANLQFSEITGVPVGSAQKLRAPVCWLGQPYGVVECDVRLVYCDRWGFMGP